MTAADVRVPLSRQKVLQAAVGLADVGGVEVVTMRRLAEALGVEAMSLYHHVGGKEDLLDGMVALVVAEANERVGVPDVTAGWKQALRERMLTAREVMLRHRWAPAVLETRTSISPEAARYYDGVLDLLRAGGFSPELAHHAVHALGSRALGFVQELFEPSEADAGSDEASAILEQMAAELPNLVWMVAGAVHDDPDSTIGWCDDQTEFEFGLDILLDGLERRLAGA